MRRHHTHHEAGQLKKPSGTSTMQTCRVEIGWRARASWPLTLILLCITAFLQVGLSKGDIGSCLSDNTCSDSSLCCSINHYCGSNYSYCGAGNCLGGPCSGNSHHAAGLSTDAVVVTAIGVVASILLFLAAILFVIHRRRRSRANGSRAEKFMDEDMEAKVLETAYKRQLSVPSTISGLSKTLSVQSAEIGRKLTYETLHWATNGFSVVIGRGSFGVVYKGTLIDGTDIAVKQLLDGQRDVQDFEAEVKTLGSINHANLVALLGFALENNQLFLIYEYVANRSLDRWIFEENKENDDFVLPWKTRVNILRGTAKGLAYLHSELQRGQMIVHLDIKPQNILLDEFFVPKIADFGLAKLLGSATTKQTLAAGGTKGYMAPEIYVAAVSQKMDVYSFGMLMLEVVGGREHVDLNVPPERLFLPAWAIRKVFQGEEVDVVDFLLEEEEFDPNQAERLIWIALLCLQGDPDDRPGMSDVLRMMDAIVDPPDLPPTLQAELEKVEKLVRGRQSGGTSSSRDSSDNMIRFSGDSKVESRKYKGRRQKGSDSRSNEKPSIDRKRAGLNEPPSIDHQRRVSNTSGF